MLAQLESPRPGGRDGHHRRAAGRSRARCSRARCRKRRAEKFVGPRPKTSISARTCRRRGARSGGSLRVCRLRGWAGAFLAFDVLAGQFLYAAWWWAVIAAGFLLGWLSSMTLPRLPGDGPRSARSHAAHSRAVRSGFSPQYRSHPATSACWRSITRAMWMRWWLAAVLPGEPAYVAKKELAGQILLARCCGD